jgi:hypothetical protein
MKTPEELAEELDRQAVLYVSLKARNDVSYYVGMDCYKAGYQAAAPQWISVKDRLPEIGEWVLINGPEVCQRIEPPSSNWDWKFAWATDHESFYEPTDVTHWMALPKPPKEEA